MKSRLFMSVAAGAALAFAGTNPAFAEGQAHASHGGAGHGAPHGGRMNGGPRAGGMSTPRAAMMSRPATGGSYRGSQQAEGGRRTAGGHYGGLSGAGYGDPAYGYGYGADNTDYDGGNDDAVANGYAYQPGVSPYDQSGVDYSQDSGNAPILSGRSAAVFGDRCATPVKVCTLYQASYAGLGCSCRIDGGRARGVVIR